jgi:hypothetical protein
MKVLVCSCNYRDVDSEFVDYFFETLYSKHDGIQFYKARPRGSLLDVMMSVWATKFLEGDYDYFVHVDNDILFDLDRLIQLVKSAEETQEVVSGCYVKRETNSLIVAPLPDGPERIELGPDGCLVEVKYVPTGFICIPRKVLEDIKIAKVHTEDIEFYPFFVPIIKADNEYIALDFAFSERARQAGHKIYLDTRIVLGHVGRYVYVPVIQEAKT